MTKHRRERHETSSPEGDWQYKPEDEIESQPTPAIKPLRAPESVSWTASEFVSHQKGSNWYFLFALATVAATALVYLITRDVITASVIVIVAIAFGILAARKPRVLDYTVSSTGLQIGPKFYPYTMFKSFAVIAEGAIDSIVLMPLKRFMPPLTIYFEPKDGEHIAQVLTNYLPYEERDHDMVEKFMRRIKF